MEMDMPSESLIAVATDVAPSQNAAPSQRAQKNLERVRHMAQERGWRCLSTTFLGWKQNHLFQCEHGHTWSEWPFNMKKRKQCPGCLELKIEAQRQATLIMFQDIAQARGGKCLSTTFTRLQSKLDWECHLGHQWSALAQSVKDGSWCPECSAGLGERITRQFFEQLFDGKFPSAYPDWLRNNEGNKLQLDGYNETLGIAFEHQGEQHYSHKTHFSSTPEKLKRRQANDAQKRKLCDEHGIKLFIIPEVPRLTHFDDVKACIRSECSRLGVALPPDFDTTTVNYLKAYQPDRLAELQEIAEAHKGKLLSNHYLGCFEKLLFECEEHHQFWAAPAQVRQGKWCRKCATARTAKTLMGSLEEVQNIARERGGECLSTEYLGAHKKLKFRCDEGHEWEASPANIKSGKWCPVHAMKAISEHMCGIDRKNPDGKKGIERCHEIAAQRDGQCLSETYVSAKTPMRWKCNKDGHEWETTFDAVRRGTWCPHPEHNGGVKLTLEIAQARARERGGECLTTEYINARTKMRWRCHRGHEWEATMNDFVTRNRWCKECPPD